MRVVEHNKEGAREMCVKIGVHRFSVIIGLSLMGVVLWDSVLVSQDAQAAVRSVSVCAWKQYDWSGMSSAERQLWSQLGWTQSRWDSDKAPVSDSKSWAELSAGEKNAASRLGYNSRNWETTCSSKSGLNSKAERTKASLEAITN